MFTFAGRPIFNVFSNDINLGQFFKINGPMIFYTYKPTDNVDHFYLNASHNPHSVPKRFKHIEGLTVDTLSRTYKHQHSSLMAIENGNIVGFVNPSQPIQDILPDIANYRLGDLYNSHSTSENHFDVSVRFINGGDMFLNPVLVCAMDGETIKEFSKRLLAKIAKPDHVALCIKSLKINIGDEHFKCNSTEKIIKPDSLTAIPVYTVDAKRLPSHLKHCDSEYKFYFYDKTKPCDRVTFTYTSVTVFNPEQLSSVIDKFIELKEFTPENCTFFDSQGTYEFHNIK